MAPRHSQQAPAWLRRKHAVARAVARALIHEPGVRCVLLVSSLARGAARPDSDVDLTVVTTRREGYRSLHRGGESVDVHYTAIGSIRRALADTTWRPRIIGVLRSAQLLAGRDADVDQLLARARVAVGEPDLPAFAAAFEQACRYRDEASRRLRGADIVAAGAFLQLASLYAWQALQPLHGQSDPEWIPDPARVARWRFVPRGFAAGIARVIGFPRDGRALAARAQRLSRLYRAAGTAARRSLRTRGHG